MKLVVCCVCKERLGRKADEMNKMLPEILPRGLVLLIFSKHLIGHLKALISFLKISLSI